jgi:hypothetical protein
VLEERFSLCDLSVKTWKNRLFHKSIKEEPLGEIRDLIGFFPVTHEMWAVRGRLDYPRVDIQSFISILK